jgi:hypothetical protein
VASWHTPIDGSAIWRDITTEIEGKTINGTYAFSDWMITVKSLHGKKSKQLDGSNPVRLARQMLAELAQGLTDDE